MIPERDPETNQVIAIEVINRQTELPVDRRLLKRAVRMILKEDAIPEARISIAVVDDATIHGLNRQYLKHNEPTDVLSFVLERSARLLDGEVVVSADTARAVAPRFGWSAGDELLLYVIHGTLHLVGCDDVTPADRAEMRARERACLARFGLQPQDEETARENHADDAQRPLGPTPGGTTNP